MLNLQVGDAPQNLIEGSLTRGKATRPKKLIKASKRRPRFEKQLRILLGVGLFSGVINILALGGSFYMLQVYDRVLPSGSVATLIGISVLMVGLYVVNGVLDYVRSRIMSRVGARIDEDLSPHVFRAIETMPLRTRAGGDGLLPIRDLDQIRTFMSGLGPTALFDLPWIPIYLLFVYMLHPDLGMLASIGGDLAGRHDGADGSEKCGAYEGCSAGRVGALHDS